MFVFKDSKYGKQVFKKGYQNIQLTTETSCLSSIYKEGKCYFFDINCEKDLANIVDDLDKDTKLHFEIPKYNFSNLNGRMKIKLKFRYNKFETKMLHQTPGTIVCSGNIKDEQKIVLDMTVKDVWINGDYGGLQWIANSITFILSLSAL